MTILEALKNSEPAEALLLLRDDDAAQKVLVAWTQSFPKWVMRELEQSEIIKLTPVELVARAWGASHVDIAYLSTLAALPENTVAEKLEMLANLRLIFPDGSASSRALEWIRGRIVLNKPPIPAPAEPAHDGTHITVICQKCKTIISQCRCLGPKAESYSLCENCSV